MARPRKWSSEAERLAAYRERQAADVDPALPERDVDEAPAPEGTRSVEVLLTLPADTKLSEAEEQLLRDHFGYTASDRRTRGERNASAQKILAEAPPTEPLVLAIIRQLRDEERRQREKIDFYMRSLQEKK